LGYRLYRSNSLKEEFSRINAATISDTVFTDSLSLRSLNNEIFYKLVAIDKNFNPSAFSNVITVVKPDTIIPASPLIESAEIKGNYIHLVLIPSPSTDVANYLLTRISDNDTLERSIQKITDDTKLFTDSLVQAPRTYLYNLFAIDQAGNRSSALRPVEVRFIGGFNMRRMNAIKIIENKNENRILIKWTDKKKEYKKIMVYRKVNEGAMVQYQFVEGSETTFTDSDVMPGNTYSYKLRAIYHDGSYSLFSDNYVVIF